jgi:hypothetical protein
MFLRSQEHVTSNMAPFIGVRYTKLDGNTMLIKSPKVYDELSLDGRCEKAKWCPSLTLVNVAGKNGKL